MKIILFSLLGVFTITAQAHSLNLKNTWSVGTGAGFPLTFNGNRFDQRADGDFAFNFHLKYYFNNSHSLSAGYARYEFDHTPTCPRVYDLLYLNRLNPHAKLSPIIGLGLGVADIPNYNVDENLKLSTRAKLGLEYLFSAHWSANLSIDYLYISKMIGERRSLTIGEIHTIVPQIGINYLFDN